MKLTPGAKSTSRPQVHESTQPRLVKLGPDQQKYPADPQTHKQEEKTVVSRYQAVGFICGTAAAN